MYATLIVLSVGIGYIYCQVNHYWRYTLARQAGHKYYLPIFIIGICWVSLSYFLVALFYSFGHTEFIGAPSLVNWILIFLLATSAAYATALFRNHELNEIKAIREINQNDLDRLILDAMESKKYLQLTLTNGKIYIGQVYESIEPDADNAYLTIVPIMGGFRKEGGVAKLTHKYKEIIKVLEEEDDQQYPDFRLIIPKSTIVTCHYFHAGIYNQVREDQKTSINY